MKSPRAVAAGILTKWTQLGDPPAIPERGTREWAGLAARDRAFAFDLITGVIRWRGTLDAILAGLLKGPAEDLEMKVRAVLWIGAYQMLMHTSMRNYAAVDSSVELAREVDAGRAAGLVNAVLRGISRLKGIVEVRHGLSPRVFPRDFTTHVRFDKDVFPYPGRDPIGHLAAVTSHPRKLVEALIAWHTEPVATNILIRNNQRPVVILRTDDPTFAPPTESGLVAHEEPGYVVAADGWNVAIESLVNAGVLSPQDPTSGKVVAQLRDLVPQPKRVLDLCAGLGTKAIQMARAWPNAEVTASDLDMAKLAKLAQRAKALGLTIKTVGARELAGSFDVVLADVPCSNTGVMARRVQSRWRWPTLDLPRLLATQTDLLHRARQLLAPGGILSYATCSIDPRENQHITEAALRQVPKLQKLAEQFTLPSFSDQPHQTHDGGYFTLLR
jgi:16S rRNA (cytosine967-C5)-methyltransferase